MFKCNKSGERVGQLNEHNALILRQTVAWLFP